jgi:hypothetical protein
MAVKFVKNQKVVAGIKNSDGELEYFSGVVLGSSDTKVKIEFTSGKKKKVLEVLKKYVKDAVEFKKEEKEKASKEKNKKEPKEEEDLKVDNLDDNFDNELGDTVGGLGDEEDRYDDMSLKALKKECTSRDLSFEDDDNEETLKYILRSDDKGEENSETVVEDEYDDMSLKALKKECAKRDIDIEDDDDEDTLKEKLRAEKETVHEETISDDISNDDDKVNDKRRTSESDETETELPQSYFSIGDEDDEVYNPPNENRTYRFFLKEDEDANLTFLTPKPITLREHNLKINGKWGNFYTCLTPLGQRCPICEAGLKSSTVKAFYVVDHRSYKDKNGKQHKDSIRVMPMKQKSYKIFKKQVMTYFKGEGEISYQYLKVGISRSTSDGSPGTGDIFNILGKTKEIPREWKVNKDGKKFDIESLSKEFAPVKKEIMARVVNRIDDDSENND